MTFSLSKNPDGTWSVRDGSAVIGPFETWAQASAYVLEREREWKRSDAAPTEPEPPASEGEGS